MTKLEPPSDDLMREQRLQRNLKIVVALLGLLIFVGLGAVAFRMISLASRPAGSAAPPRIVSDGVRGSNVSFELPRGAKIVSIALSGNRLAVQHDGPAGPGITILDAETGRHVLELKPTEALPHN